MIDLNADYKWDKIEVSKLLENDKTDSSFFIIKGGKRIRQ